MKPARCRPASDARDANSAARRRGIVRAEDRARRSHARSTAAGIPSAGADRGGEDRRAAGRRGARARRGLRGVPLGSARRRGAQRRSRGLRWCSGHEGAGVVEEIGPGVRSLRRGDPVVIALYGPCGECGDCRAGNVAGCWSETRTKNMYGLMPDGTTRLSVRRRGGVARWSGRARSRSSRSCARRSS